MIVAVAGVLFATSVPLFLFGGNFLYLSWRSLRVRAAAVPAVRPGAEPAVCVQVPLYDERYVAERVIAAVAALDWPRDRLEIQVLDDSDDDTAEIAAAAVAALRARGLKIRHLRRGARDGYKAGALAAGLLLTQAPFVAVFDADFVPEPDFLRRTLGAFDDPTVGFVQARWGHLNEGYSWFTRLQALAIDFHFLVEQAVRSSAGWFTNFTGTAGVWRRAAIEDAGGWSARTLTEDLDLSYRAQLAGWRAVYLQDLVVPEELPVSLDAYRRQQSRWATGSFQSAFHLLPKVVTAPLPPGAKFQAAVHLLSYGVGPAMLLQLACFPVLLMAKALHLGTLPPLQVPLAANVICLAPWCGFIVAQSRRGRGWRAGLPGIVCQVLGAGMSLTVLLAFFRALRAGGEFVRTPKHRIVRSGEEWHDKAYVRVGDPRVLLELLLGAAAGALVPLGVRGHEPLIATYSAMFAAGFAALVGVSAVQGLEVLALRRLGLGALRRLQRGAPALAAFVLATVLLAAFTRIPDPFEDSYQHWLMAAHLAAAGSLRDPIFSMQDTWLPGYQVLAATVLKVFGLWRLDLLKLLSAALGLGTLVCVARLAPNGRQGRIAVTLLALNPVFLLVSTDAVAEPLLTLLLTAAALEGVRGRSIRAAALLLAACLVGTKAWLWVAALAAVMTVPWLVKARPALRPGLAWAPALAVAAGLQLGFAPATHSVARAAQEAASATARGSLPGSPLSRLLELVGTYGLATLPLAVPAPAGLASIRRDAARLCWLHLPALIYLGAVIVLVTAGVYSGSHRYIYVALPSLALMAAALLDRAPAPAWALSAAAAAVLTAGFVPVFQGFAAANRGLEAAGLAAASTPGRLLTDSPVVAYFSHKPPDQVAGSMVLPPGRAEALAYLRRNGYTAVVLERISYYPAVGVFPDLAAGRPGYGFMPLGDESRYQASGGKTALAYWVLKERWSAPLFGRVRLVVSPQPAEGKTAPLAKGAYLVSAGRSLAGEGMGFGVPIVRYAAGWWFPGSATTTDISGPDGPAWERVFRLDETGGDGGRFIKTASRGSIAVIYQVVPDGLRITVKPLQLAPGALQTAVLNEESAAFDDFADPGRTLIGGAFGPVVPSAGPWARLRSGRLGVEWSQPALAGARLEGGRELGGYLDWAGLEYQFGPDFTGTTYIVHIQEAR